MRRRLALILVLVLATIPIAAWGQATGVPVQTIPYPATTAGGNASGTISTTGTFQEVFSASPTPAGGLSGASGGQRHGCAIQNQSASDKMYVSEGQSAATATEAASWILAPGATFYCERNGVVLSGEIDITGTATDAFYAAQY